MSIIPHTGARSVSEKRWRVELMRDEFTQPMPQWLGFTDRVASFYVASFYDALSEYYKAAGNYYYLFQREYEYVNPIESEAA